MKIILIIFWYHLDKEKILSTVNDGQFALKQYYNEYILFNCYVLVDNIFKN